MLFLDGVGIGRRDPSVNPFFVARLPALRSLLGGAIPTLRERSIATADAIAIPLDATLGVRGLPQSGTGQTTLFTGVNAARVVGKHFGPHPYSTLRPILEERSIFRQLTNQGRVPYFANAFPQRFFDYAAQRRSRLTVTTLSCIMSGVRLLRAEDLLAGNGISADVTGIGWRELGYPGMPVIEAAEAGRRLARLAASHDFVLFEYWKTDHAGHAQSMDEAVRVLEQFDGMLSGIVESMDVRDTLLLVTSDHGNLEDLSTRTHTRNPVPAILYGYRHADVAKRLRRESGRAGDLTFVAPALMQYLTYATLTAS